MPQSTLRAFFNSAMQDLQSMQVAREKAESLAKANGGKQPSSSGGAGAGSSSSAVGKRKRAGDATSTKKAKAGGMPFAKGCTEVPLPDAEYTDQCYAFARPGKLAEKEEVLVTGADVVAMADTPKMMGKFERDCFAVLPDADGDHVVELVPKDEKAVWPNLCRGVRVRRVASLEQKVGDTLWLDVPENAPGQEARYTDGLREVATAAADTPKGTANIAVSSKGVVWLIEASKEAGMSVMARIDLSTLPEGDSPCQKYFKNESKLDEAPKVALWGGGGVCVIGFRECRTVYFVGARAGDQLGKVLHPSLVVDGGKVSEKHGILAMAVSETAASTPSVFATTSVGGLFRLSLLSCFGSAAAGTSPASIEDDIECVTCVKGKHAYPFYMAVSDVGVVATASQSSTDVTLWNARAEGGLKKLKVVKAYPKWDRMYQHELMGVALSADGTRLAVKCSTVDPPLHKVFVSH